MRAFAVVFVVGCALLACAAPDPAAPPPPEVQTGHQGLLLEVPGQFASIGAAIRAADDGDEVVVAAGTYEEGFVLDKDLTVRGAGMGRTVLRRGISVRDPGRATVRDMTIEGQGGGIGVNIQRRLTRLVRVEVTGFRTGIFVRQAFGEFRLDGGSVVGNVVGIEMTQVLGGRIASNVVAANTRAGILARDGVERFVIAHNTVVGNGFGGQEALDAGIALGPFGQEVVENNIVVGNRAGVACTTCRTTFRTNNVWGNVADYTGDGAAGETDISADPRFVAPQSQDFHLRPDSPCIDAGGDLRLGVDRDGQPRLSGDAPDMGAYELRAAPPQLVINEVMANPLDETTGEYVEIVNTSAEEVALVGFRLDDGDAEDVIAGLEGGRGLVPPGGFALVLDADYEGQYDPPPGAVLVTVGDSRLGNGLSVGDPITLRAPDGTVVSTWSEPFNPGNGVSVERVRTDAADVRASWVASPCGASPGRVNCVVQPPAEDPPAALLVTEVMANPLNEGTGEFVELHNAGAAPIDLDRWRISDGDEEDLLVPWRGGSTVIAPGAYAVVLDPGYADQYDLPPGGVRLTTTGATIGNGLAVSDPVTLRDRDGELQATFSNPFNPGNGRSAERIALDAPDVRDNWVAAACGGDVAASPGRPNCAAEAPPPVERVTVAITEVMANPLDEDTGEYVELFNFGAEPVDAATLLIDDGDAIDTLEGLGGGPTLIPPGGFAVIFDPEFAGQYAIPDDAVRLRPDDTTIGSGLATNDVIRLLDAGQVEVSRWPAPFNPGNGRSVERIALDRDGPEVWIASPCPAGFSPGRANCAGDIGVPPEPDAPPPVVITEVMANPVNDRIDEFVELFNIGEGPVDLATLRLYDGDAIDTIEAFEGGATVLAPGRFAVIVDRGYAGDYAIDADALVVTVDDQTLGSGLSTSDPVSLLLDDGVTVVSSFSSPSDPGNGRSVVRTAIDAEDAPASWRPTECADGRTSTPGREDCVVEDADLDCRADDDCAPGLRCNGIPFDGSGMFGRCVDFSNVEGAGDPCPPPAYDCPVGLTCMGWSINSVRPDLWANPWCVLAWQAGTFEGAAGAIPDGGQLTSAAVVYGLATVPLDIVVTVRLAHPDPSQLRITVLDPNGTDARIFDGAEDDPAILDAPIVALGNISRDDAVNGRWTLRVEDRAEGGQGDLDGWTLHIVSNFD